SESKVTDSRDPGLAETRCGFANDRSLYDAYVGRAGCSPSSYLLPSISAMRAFTIFFSRAAGRGLSTGKWIVPFDVWKSLSSFLNAFITDAVGNKLQWSKNAAYHTSTPLCLNAGMP